MTPTPFEWIRQTDLKRKLIDRYLLSKTPDIADPMKMSNTVVLVSDLDLMLSTIKIDMNTNYSISSAGVKYPTSVPVGRRWYLHGVYYYVNNVDPILDAIEIYDNTSNIIVEIFADATEKALLFSQPIPMEEKWQLGFRIKTYTATRGVKVAWLYTEHVLNRST